MKIINKKIIQRIDTLLSIKGETVYSMCQSLCIQRAKFSQFKREKTNLNKDEFMKISSYLNVPPEFLYYGDDYKKIVNKIYDEQINKQQQEILLLKEQLQKYNAVKKIINKPSKPKK